MNNLTDEQRAFFKAANNLLKSAVDLRRVQKAQQARASDPFLKEKRKLAERTFDKALQKMKKHQDAYGQMTIF